jgi:hypothetical protein
VFLSISPETSFGKSVISAEKSIDAALDRINISIIRIQTYSNELIKINPSVMDISTKSSMPINFLNSILSIIRPMRGAKTTAGNIAMVAVTAIVISSAPKETIMEKMAT